MKRFFLLIITFCSIFLSACGGPYAEFSRHLCRSLEQMRNRIGFGIKVPSFIQNVNEKEYKIKYYTTATPAYKSVGRTGYSITIDCMVANEKDFKKIELRGVDLSRAGKGSEDFKEEYYKCVMDETAIESNGRKLFYSAYRDKSNKNSVKIAGYFKDSFDYFYVYFMDGDIRYSIIFSGFTSPSGKETVDVCLKKAESYFKNFDLGELTKDVQVSGVYLSEFLCA